MFGIFQRRRLVKKGLASPKARRRCSQNEWRQKLETGNVMKALILLAFISGLAALIFSGNGAQPTQIFLVAFLIFLTALGQLWINHPNTFAKNSRILLVLGTIFLQLAMAKAIFVLGRHGTLFDVRYIPLFIPYAFAPLVLSVLLGKNHGVYAVIFVSLWQAIILSYSPGSTATAVYIVMGLICGFIAVFLTIQVRRRSRLIRAGVSVGFATMILAIVFSQILIPWELFGSIDWFFIGKQCAAAVGAGILTAIIVSGLLPMFENIFQITTDISWLESADLNHPLLKRMTIEAPGTYHHSLVVGNLAEAAAESVGANPTMCRVCSYFHDIGKLVKPDYFTENMEGRHNPHDELAPTMSALIIIAHVKEGIDLALKYRLNQQIIDVIRQHHGTSIVFYFYKRALDQQEDARQGGKIMNIREEDIPAVSEESFRYPGPKPQTREAAIISLADSIESASRSMDRPTPQKAEQIIRDIMRKRLVEGQLDECDLTVSDLKKIAQSFQRTLNSMMHRRVPYPAEKEKEEKEHGSPRRPADAPPISAA